MTVWTSRTKNLRASYFLNCLRSLINSILTKVRVLRQQLSPGLSHPNRKQEILRVSTEIQSRELMIQAAFIRMMSSQRKSSSKVDLARTVTGILTKVLLNTDNRRLLKQRAMTGQWEAFWKPLV